MAANRRHPQPPQALARRKRSHPRLTDARKTRAGTDGPKSDKKQIEKPRWRLCATASKAGFFCSGETIAPSAREACKIDDHHAGVEIVGLKRPVRHRRIARAVQPLAAHLPKKRRSQAGHDTEPQRAVDLEQRCASGDCKSAKAN